MTLADNIRELRNREGLTQADLAQALGVTKEVSAVGTWA